TDGGEVAEANLAVGAGVLERHVHRGVQGDLAVLNAQAGRRVAGGRVDAHVEVRDGNGAGGPHLVEFQEEVRRGWRHEVRQGGRAHVRRVEADGEVQIDRGGQVHRQVPAQVHAEVAEPAAEAERGRGVRRQLQTDGEGELLLVDVQVAADGDRRARQRV